MSLAEVCDLPPTLPTLASSQPLLHLSLTSYYLYFSSQILFSFNLCLIVLYDQKQYMYAMKKLKLLRSIKSESLSPPQPHCLKVTTMSGLVKMQPDFLYAYIYVYNTNIQINRYIHKHTYQVLFYYRDGIILVVVRCVLSLNRWRVSLSDTSIELLPHSFQWL